MPLMALRQGDRPSADHFAELDASSARAVRKRFGERLDHRASASEPPLEASINCAYTAPNRESRSAKLARSIGAAVRIAARPSESTYRRSRALRTEPSRRRPAERAGPQR